MKMEGIGSSTVINKYTYNYKELNDDFGLNWHDYGARWYDAALGRWWAVDPLAEPQANYSPYAYTFNNPLSFMDPTGMMGEGADGLNNDQWLDRTRKDGGYWEQAKQDLKINTNRPIQDLNGNTRFIGDDDLEEDAQVTPYGTRVYVGGVLIFDNLEGYNVTIWPPHNGYKGDVHTDADGVFVHDGNGWLSLSNGSRILPELTIRASIQNLEGIKLAATGFLLSTGETSMFNQKTWYSLYQLKTYSQSFNGNGFTGGKIAHGKFWSTKLAYAGKLLGIYQGYDILTQYRSGKLSFNKFLVEETSNVYSTLGGLSGAAWGVGWESGRLLTQTNIYHRQIFLRFIPEGRDGLLSTDR